MTALQTLSGIEICGSSSAAMGGSVSAVDGTRTLAMAAGTSAADTAVANPTADSPGKGDGMDGSIRVRPRAKAASTSFRKIRRPLAALQNLTTLKKLTIYKLGNFTEDDNLLLLSAIEHLSSCSLKFLAVDDGVTGFLDGPLNSSEAPPEHLYTLKLSGKLTEVPKWIDRLHNLEKLTLSLTSFTTETLPILGELPELFSLIFSLDSAMEDPSIHKILHKNALKSGGTIFVPAGGFKKLKLLRFLTPVLPPLSFLEGAMPELQRLELRFRMVEGVYGLENLAKLQQVFITVSSQAPKDAKEKVSQIKVLAGKIRNAPTVVMDEYNELSKVQ